MKKTIAVLFTLVLAASLPGSGIAAWNPAAQFPNLHTVTFNTAFPTATGDYYGPVTATAVNGAGSALCVGCHSRNPAYTQPQTGGLDTGKSGEAGLGLRNNNSLRMAGSHFVTDFDSRLTSKGGGYEALRAANIYMAAIPATPPTHVKAQALYGVLSGGNVTNTTDPTVSGAQMICDSCHRMKSTQNTGGYARLIAEGLQNDNSALCVTCHGDMDGKISAEWQYFAENGSITWGGTHHHRNSHSTLADSIYLGANAASDFPAADHEMGTIAKAYYDPGGVYGANTLFQMWAAYTEVTGSRDIQWNNARVQAAPSDTYIGPTRNKNNASAKASDGGGTLICTNCHRGHFGDTSMGATVLLKTSGTVATAMGNDSLLSSPNGPRDGVIRLSERPGHRAVFDQTNPLCLGCHK